jgi:hypothetical protein
MRAVTMRAHDMPRVFLMCADADIGAPNRAPIGRPGPARSGYRAERQVIRFLPIPAHSPSEATARNPSRAIIFHRSDTAAASLVSSVERSTT